MLFLKNLRFILCGYPFLFHWFTITVQALVILNQQCQNYGFDSNVLHVEN